MIIVPQRHRRTDGHTYGLPWHDRVL